MAETPETPTPSLAELLENTADWLDAVRHPDRGADVRDAAAQLRQLDRIKAALDEEIRLDDLLHILELLSVTARDQVTDDEHWACSRSARLLRIVRVALEADDGA